MARIVVPTFDNIEHLDSDEFVPTVIVRDCEKPEYLAYIEIPEDINDQEVWEKMHTYGWENHPSQGLRLPFDKGHHYLCQCKGVYSITGSKYNKS